MQRACDSLSAHHIFGYYFVHMMSLLRDSQGNSITATLRNDGNIFDDYMDRPRLAIVTGLYP